MSAAQSTSGRPISARAGIGLRTPHAFEVACGHARVDWVEVHSENYFADGGEQIEQLARIRGLYPLSLHGVGLSLGSVDPLDREHLRKLKRLVNWSEPAIVSEHLSWTSINGIFLNDLLPMPYTDEALRHMIRRVDQLQDFLGRQILIENISSYLRFDCLQLPEWTFIGALACESGCGLLVDVNNVFVTAHNHGLDAYRYISALPAKCVHEIHLAGHTVTVRDGRVILIDTHAAPVCEEVWQLYVYALKCFGVVPTLIEWDADIPELDVLVAEAQKADAYLETSRALVA